MLGLGAGRAGADTVDEPAETAPAGPTTTVAPEPTGREDDLDRAAQAATLMAAIPESKKPSNPEPEPAPDPSDEPSAPPPTTPTPSPSAGQPVTEVAADLSPDRRSTQSGPTGIPDEAKVAAGRRRSAPPEAATHTGPGSAASPVPTEKPAPVAPAPAGPPTAATSTSTVTAKSSDAAPAPSAATLQPEDVWWPAWTEELVDQRIAAAWRETPVRGPPPGMASALGNDGRTTIYQVAIVDGPDGFEVSISFEQTATVNNVGVAQADAAGPGDATAVGNSATTTIYQTSVVVQKGSGTATVAQDAKVDNLGMGTAVTADADAAAVGNESSTTIHQTAVVVILGSGDGTVSQQADVHNVGAATAVATDKPATAAGNRSTTDVNQVAVVVVHEEDATITQTSTTDNIGVATAIGGTATGNVATNSVEQVAAVKS